MGMQLPTSTPTSSPPHMCCAPASQGFYGVYDELFQRLAKQEQEAHERRTDRKGKRPPGPFPRFGTITGCAVLLINVCLQQVPPCHHVHISCDLGAAAVSCCCWWTEAGVATLCSATAWQPHGNGRKGAPPENPAPEVRISFRDPITAASLQAFQARHGRRCRPFTPNGAALPRSRTSPGQTSTTPPLRPTAG